MVGSCRCRLAAFEPRFRLVEWAVAAAQPHCLGTGAGDGRVLPLDVTVALWHPVPREGGRGGGDGSCTERPKGGEAIPRSRMESGRQHCASFLAIPGKNNFCVASGVWLFSFKKTPPRAPNFQSLR